MFYRSFSSFFPDTICHNNFEGFVKYLRGIRKPIFLNFTAKYAIISLFCTQMSNSWTKQVPCLNHWRRRLVQDSILGMLCSQYFNKLKKTLTQLCWTRIPSTSCEETFYVNLFVGDNFLSVR